MKSWKKFNSKDFTKEYLQDKTITLIINEKISNKKQEFALLLNHGDSKKYIKIKTYKSTYKSTSKNCLIVSLSFLSQYVKTWL